MSDPIWVSAPRIAVDVVAVVGAGLLLFLTSTVVFDVVHWTLHRFSASRNPLLRGVGALHEAHHTFLGRDLRHDESQLRNNILRHVVPEFLTQLTVSALFLLFLPWKVVAVAAALQVLVFALIMKAKGKDINHVEVDRLTAYHPIYFCTPPYHRLHHIHPGSYYSSWIKAFDHLAGTGTDLRDRGIVLVGTSGFGDALRRRLEGERGEPIPVLDERDPYRRALEGGDVFVLAGDPDLHARHVASILEYTAGRRFPIEIWGCAPADGECSDYEAEGRRLYADPRVIYRHIVGAAPGSGRGTADAALFFIRRGFNWVPGRPELRSLLEFVRFRRLSARPG